MLLAVLGAKRHCVAPADADIELGVFDRTRIGPKPFHDFLGVRPGGVDRGGRGLEPPLEGEAGFDEDVGGGPRGD